MIALATCTTLAVAGPAGASTPPSELEPAIVATDGGLEIAVQGGVVQLDPATLGARLTPERGASMPVSEPAVDGALAGEVDIHGSQASWTLSGGTRVTIDLVRGGESFSLTLDGAESGSTADWPLTGRDSSTGAIQFANGSGQTIPIRDPFWNGSSAGLAGASWEMAGGLTLPVWGVTNADRLSGVAFYTPTDIGTTLSFDSTEGVLRATASHDFSATDGPYTVVVTATDGAEIAAAAPYRDHLESQGQFVTLDQKIDANPSVGALIGALHAYVWGTGRTSSMLRVLRSVGIDRAWLGFDADGSPPPGSYVAAAQSSGYLVAPYDVWANAQPTDSADTAASIWPDGVYPGGCVRDAAGAIVTGFQGRGCYLSSTALDMMQKTSGLITDRVGEFANAGELSYFLDVDAAGELFSDSSPDHPQSAEQDRRLRLERLSALARGDYSGGQAFVVGSESAAAWANPGISFSHGSSTPVFDALWLAERDKESWGGYWPRDRPAFFFAPAALPDGLTKAMFDPVYRIPLYQAVLHDSVVSTDRWELDAYKVDGAHRDRTLLAMLYNSPTNYAWDVRSFRDHAVELADVSRFFAAIQEVGGTERLTGFRVLDAAGQVQQVTYEGGLVLTANFGTEPGEGVGAGCIVARGGGIAERSLCL